MISPQMLAQILPQIIQFLNNPQEMIKRMQIPKEYQNNPNGMIQKLMNDGKLTQGQYNNFQQTADQIKDMLKNRAI